MPVRDVHGDERMDAGKREQDFELRRPRDASVHGREKRYRQNGTIDRQILAKQLGISPHQLSYVTHSGPGEGLLFFGNVIIPFVDHFPRDTMLYSVLTTRPEEVGTGRIQEAS